MKGLEIITDVFNKNLLQRVYWLYCNPFSFFPFFNSESGHMAVI